MTPAQISAWGSAATGAGSLLGAFTGGSDQKIDYRGAKKGIRWRVRDAKAAGIHPLYAMGAPGIGQGVLKSSSGSQLPQALGGAGRAASGYAEQKQQQIFNAASIDEKAARTELLRTEKDWIQEQIDASVHNRTSQAAKSYGLGPASPPIMPAEIWTPKGWQQNPDTAIGIEEVAGTALSRLLHSRPSEWDIKEFFLGPWLRAMDLQPQKAPYRWSR